MTTISAELKHKYGTAAAWTSADPTLLAGQLGFESDTRKFKIGDGVTAWTALAYKTITAAEIASLTSAELRTICSDETGTGSLVFATSPTLVTPAIGTPSSGNVGNCTGQYYALSVGATTYAAPADSVTVYFGNRYNSPTGTPDITRVYIPRGGTIIRADVLGFAATAGSNESWEMYIRLNNTTDTLIQALASSSATRVWSNAALSVTVAAGDYIEIKLVNPAWGTNPANVSYGGNILIVTA